MKALYLQIDNWINALSRDGLHEDLYKELYKDISMELDFNLDPELENEIKIKTLQTCKQLGTDLMR